MALPRLGRYIVGARAHDVVSGEWPVYRVGQDRSIDLLRLRPGDRVLEHPALARPSWTCPCPCPAAHAGCDGVPSPGWPASPAEPTRTASPAGTRPGPTQVAR